jgi:hypothetical protein
MPYGVDAVSLFLSANLDGPGRGFCIALTLNLGKDPPQGPNEHLCSNIPAYPSA